MIVANNGKEAIAALESVQFDLVLMDVLMPEMDGISATEDIRAREKQTGAHIPIVAMTAHAMQEDRDRCLAAGMDGYVSKPVRPDQLFATIDEVINETRPDHKPSAQPSNSDALDLSKAIEAVGGKREQLKPLAELMLEECPRLIAEINVAVANHDAPFLRLAAHTLKGSVRIFGADRAAERAEQLEAMGQAGDLHDADEAFSELKLEIKRVASALSELVGSSV